MTAPATPPRTTPSAPKDNSTEATPPTWTIDEAEALLRTLPAIASAKVLRDADGTVRDVHVLATTDLGPKQIVRNVESALLARFGVVPSPPRAEAVARSIRDDLYHEVAREMGVVIPDDMHPFVVTLDAVRFDPSAPGQWPSLWKT